MLETLFWSTFALVLRGPSQTTDRCGFIRRKIHCSSSSCSAPSSNPTILFIIMLSLFKVLLATLAMASLTAAAPHKVETRTTRCNPNLQGAAVKVIDTKTGRGWYTTSSALGASVGQLFRGECFVCKLRAFPFSRYYTKHPYQMAHGVYWSTSQWSHHQVSVLP